MSLRYAIFGKLITLDDFITEARKREITAVRVVPSIDNREHRYFFSESGHSELYTRIDYKTKIIVIADENNVDPFDQLRVTVRTLHFGHEYWGAPAFLNRKNNFIDGIARVIPELEASRNIAQRLQDDGFKIRVRAYMFDRDYQTIEELEVGIAQYKKDLAEKAAAGNRSE